MTGERTPSGARTHERWSSDADGWPKAAAQRPARMRKASPAQTDGSRERGFDGPLPPPNFVTAEGPQSIDGQAAPSFPGVTVRTEDSTIPDELRGVAWSEVQGWCDGLAAMGSSSADDLAQMAAAAHAMGTTSARPC